MRMWCILCMLMLILTSNNGDAARILGLFPYPGISHFIAFSPLLEELAKRGHEMTIVTAYPRKSAMKNYKEIIIEKYYHHEGRPVVNYFERHDTNRLHARIAMQSRSLEYCEYFLNEPAIQNLIQSTDLQFDLIIYEPFITECAYGIVHKFKAPFIQIFSTMIAIWMGEGVGNPATYSYIPDFSLGFTDHMSFRERLINTVLGTFIDLQRYWYFVPRMEAVMRKYFSDPTLPSIYEIETNASFLLVNTHISLNYPRPLTPNTVEVGGMHIKEPEQLPKDLQKLLDEATDGVIYFSLGTNVHAADMPDEMRSHLVNVFSKLKQKVLWKWEVETFPGLPKNVHISKWFPQKDILAHSNMRACITHGGLLSTQEATYFGVPLITIPITADQKHNALKVAAQGLAIVIDLRNVTEKALDWALQEILTDTRYRENAKHLSKIFQDQPDKPLDRAVFWSEYVIRHKGAPHMRSAALKLNFFQHHLLDVISVILLAVFLMLALLITTIKLVLQYVFSKSKVKRMDIKNKKEC